MHCWQRSALSRGFTACGNQTAARALNLGGKKLPWLFTCNPAGDPGRSQLMGNVLAADPGVGWGIQAELS